MGGGGGGGGKGYVGPPPLSNYWGGLAPPGPPSSYAYVYVLTLCDNLSPKISPSFNKVLICEIGSSTVDLLRNIISVSRCRDNYGEIEVVPLVIMPGNKLFIVNVQMLI